MDLVFTPLGASNHSKGERAENDYYATEPRAAEILLDVEPELNNIWECACGGGHLARVFDNVGNLTKATDLIDRGYGEIGDFLDENITYYNGDIVTNPPFSLAGEFVQKALSIIPVGRKVCMFLRLLFLEGKKRKELFKVYPPQTVYVFSNRINCAKNGDFKTYKRSAIAYAWFVWLKGYKGKTIIKWVN